MMRGSSRSRNFFRKLVVSGVNNSKTAIQNDCLVRLYNADAELKAISGELDSFDGKKDPNRCNLLVNQLRTAQDKVITLLFQLMDECSCERASRDYRMKFPDEILLSEGSESLNGQIWFGAECLSAGSNILNHTKESTMLRPMAKTLTTHLDLLRNDLRDLVIDGGDASQINQTLIHKMVAFDNIFANFEYEYVKTMLPIRTVTEIEMLQEVAVLFSETLIDSVKRGLIKQDDIEEYQPIVMIAIPRLAIVRGLLYKNENPIYTKHKKHMCGLFQPFYGPLHSIRRLLRGLSQHELFTLEKMLANDQSAIESPLSALRKVTQDEINKQNQKATQQHQVDKTNELTTEEVTPGTSGSTNIFTNRIDYPVTRGDPDSKSSSPPLPLAATGCCPLNVPSSSSNMTLATRQNADLPSTSSSLPSSLARDLTSAAGPSDPQRNRTLGCDKTITPSCSSRRDSYDHQMNKLMEEFNPSCNSPDLSEANVVQSSGVSPATTATITAPTEEAICTTIDNKTDDNSNEQQKQLIVKKSENDASIEEFIIKHAQQLLHRLFVAISGVADQLQSNFASDLRFILRHIFSNDDDDDETSEQQRANELGRAEDDDDEDDEDNQIGEAGSDDRDYSSNEHSDSSLPIEQGIEAQEIANLIDLESGYSPNDPSYFDQNRHHYLPPAPGADSLAYVDPSNGDYYSPTSSSYYNNNNQPATNNNMNPNNNATNEQAATTAAAAFQAPMPNVDDELLAELTRTPGQAEMIYESRTTPNEPNMMELNRHRQQLVQQHLQSLSYRGGSRSSSSRTHRHSQPTVVAGPMPGTVTTSASTGSNGELGSQAAHQQCILERRSRHHHGGSRSRRQRGPPVWVPDQLVVACSCCSVSFTLFRRRHHCRACGQIFCSECSKFTKNLNCWGYNGPVRVCEACYYQP